MSKAQTNNRYNFEKDNYKFSIGFYERKQRDDKVFDEDIYHLRKSHIISPKDETVDFSKSELDEAERMMKELWQKRGEGREPLYPSGEIIRTLRKPENPLLLIYFLDPQGAGLPENSSPIIGFAISFPRSPRAITVGYAVHQELLNLYNTDDNDDSQYEDED